MNVAWIVTDLKRFEEPASLICLGVKNIHTLKEIESKNLIHGGNELDQIRRSGRIFAINSIVSECYSQSKLNRKSYGVILYLYVRNFCSLNDAFLKTGFK